MVALIVSAPSDDIDNVEIRVRAAFRDEPLAIKAIGIGAVMEARDQAA
jgi:hypothetical protein